MSQPLYTLAVRHNGDSMPLLFSTYEGLLGVKAALVDANLPGITAEEVANLHHLYLQPETAVAHIRLWVESLEGRRRSTKPTSVPAPAAEPARTPATSAEEGGTMNRKEELMRLLVDSGGISRQGIAEHFGWKEESVSARISVATRLYGYTAHLKDGLYIVTKDRGAPAKRTLSTTRGKARAPARKRLRGIKKAAA
jgi:hypothetical protein